MSRHSKPKATPMTKDVLIVLGSPHADGGNVVFRAPAATCLTRVALLQGIIRPGATITVEPVSENGETPLSWRTKAGS
jgi:hypothetical protein